jgi:hypothetical protein
MLIVSSADCAVVPLIREKVTINAIASGIRTKRPNNLFFFIVITSEPTIESIESLTLYAFLCRRFITSFVSPFYCSVPIF